jgi:hypothetical protein
MDRETKDIQIGGHTLVVKTYATAREHQAIQRALLKDAKFDVAGETPQLSDFDPTIMFEMQAETVRQMVVSMDGTAENLVDRCLDLPSDQFDELIAELDALVSKKKR